MATMPRTRRKARHLPAYGRNTLLTEDVQAALLTLHNAGNELGVCAMALGLKPNTVLRWYRRGRDEGKEPYASFQRACDAAWAAGAIENTIHVKNHARTDPNIAWKLQQKFQPSTYGDKRPEDEQPTVALPTQQQNVQVVLLKPEDIIAYEDRMLIAERGLSKEDDDAAERALDRLVTDPDAE
jgi:hypothetical protein